MSQDAFDLLCKDVCKKIGEDVFLPAAKIKSSNSERTIKQVCGEVNVAIGLYMMAGGSYLDLVPLFDVSKSHLYRVFHEFIQIGSYLCMTSLCRVGCEKKK